MTVVVTHSTPADGSFSATGATAWNANHTLSGVGTMAEQNANAVAITGGSISGVSGVVSGVTGTAPVVSSGGTTPAISMAAATTLVDGYLTSTDWTTFNGKQAALVSGTNIKTVNSNSLLGSGNVSVGTVTSVGGTGTVNGLSLSGTVTSSGNLTFGGTLDLSSPPAIGGTAAAAGSFTTLIGGSGSANYEQITGGAAGKAVQFQSLGSDAAVSLAIQSKGTGAIDLAAGSSGVNISNGGTVTAITGTSGGAYTSIPSVAISAPTTAGGATATATAAVQLASGSTIAAAGSGYAIGDTITLVGGTPVQTSVLTVATLSGSGVATYTITTAGNYTATPSNPISTTSSGSGTGFQLTGSWTVRAGSFAITAAGSGYVEQPTVTFSGGGGSGAAAYATVGSEPTVKSLFGGVTTGGLAVATSGGTQIRVDDVGDGTRPLRLFGGSAGASQTGGIFQSVSGANIAYSTNTGIHNFYTAGRSSTLQFSVSHTASAVNYVQVTGAATGNQPSITAQGSDAAVILNLASKGVANIIFNANSAEQFRTGTIASAVNSIQANGAPAGSSPSFQARGTDTDVDLTLTPKNAGNVRFGTYTASALLAVAGYITIKDSGGTTRRLLVG
jgi:hypothetical protein